MKHSSKTTLKGDPDILYNLQEADRSYNKNLAKRPIDDETSQTGEKWIRMVEGVRNHNPSKHQDEEGNGKLLKSIGAILVVIFIILITLSYYSYVIHWFADVFTGKCSWWSLGFICTSG